jgi:CheY-like chemotaxis protein
MDKADFASPDSALVRVLHLEDSAHDAELVARALDASGVSCSITRVTTEQELESALTRGTFDVMIPDHGLASFDGTDALRCVLKLVPRLPFILLSGSIPEETAAEIKNLGARDCISKDDLTLLASAVRRALSSGSC